MTRQSKTSNTRFGPEHRARTTRTRPWPALLALAAIPFLSGTQVHAELVDTVVLTPADPIYVVPDDVPGPQPITTDAGNDPDFYNIDLSAYSGLVSMRIFVEDFGATPDTFDVLWDGNFLGNTLTPAGLDFEFDTTSSDIHVLRIEAPDTGFAFYNVIIESLGPAAECFLVIGDGPGTSTFHEINHVFNTQVGPAVEESHEVLLDDIPEFVLPIQSRRPLLGWGGKKGSDGPSVYPGFANGGIPEETPDWMLDGTFSVQVLMWNPEVFPELPEQYTPGLQLHLLPNGAVASLEYGASVGGMQIQYEIDVNEQGQRVIRFPFSIPGMPSP